MAPRRMTLDRSVARRRPNAMVKGRTLRHEVVDCAVPGWFEHSLRLPDDASAAHSCLLPGPPTLSCPRHGRVDPGSCGPARVPAGRFWLLPTFSRDWNRLK